MVNKDLIYVELMLESIITIFDYISNKTEDEFYRDATLKDACLMRLIVIGEYGIKISDTLKSNFKEVEWQVLKAARNFYVHVYDRIDWTKVWETIHSDLLPLKLKIERIIYSIENKQQ